MITKLIKFIKSLHTQGVFIPLARNGKTTSVSLTLLFISSLFVILGLLKMFQVSFTESIAWYVTRAVLYYNKTAKINKDGFEINSNE